MQTIEYAALTAHFAQHSQKARMGYSVMVMRHGQPHCILAHPSLLTASEAACSEYIAVTMLYSQLGHCCTRVEKEKAIFIITTHGTARCCIVPPEYAERIQVMEAEAEAQAALEAQAAAEAQVALEAQADVEAQAPVEAQADVEVKAA